MNRSPALLILLANSYLLQLLLHDKVLFDDRLQCNLPIPDPLLYPLPVPRCLLPLLLLLHLPQPPLQYIPIILVPFHFLLFHLCKDVLLDFTELLVLVQLGLEGDWQRGFGEDCEEGVGWLGALLLNVLYLLLGKGVLAGLLFVGVQELVQGWGDVLLGVVLRLAYLIHEPKRHHSHTKLLLSLLE